MLFNKMIVEFIMLFDPPQHIRFKVILTWNGENASSTSILLLSWVLDEYTQKTLHIWRLESPLAEFWCIWMIYLS